MPALRVERTAIRSFFLGKLGFDHLQLVYEPSVSCQDDWFVIEGVRDPAPDGPVLGVQGIDGQLTLSRANAAARGDLVAKIGTPEQRGTTVIAEGDGVQQLWLQLAREAAEIDGQRLPYVALASPKAAHPTRNSSSVVATLLHRAGFDVPACLPSSVRLVPGIETLIVSTSGAPPPTSPRHPVRDRWFAPGDRGNTQQTDQHRKWREPCGVSGLMHC